MLFVLLSFAIDLDSSREKSYVSRILGKHPFYFMAPVRVLFLGHSFIRRLQDFLLRNFNTKTATNLSLEGDLVIRWHGIGGRTISQTKAYDLHVVEEFAPNIVILQLGTNDLVTTSAAETGSAIEDLCRLLYESYGVEAM